MTSPIKGKKINFTRFNNLLKDITVNKDLTYDQIERIKEATRALEVQIVKEAKKYFSDAYSAAYDIDSKTKCFNIYDVKKTVIAFMWVDEEGESTFSANDAVCMSRMS